jgi:hypothetical protein
VQRLRHTITVLVTVTTTWDAASPIRASEGRRADVEKRILMIFKMEIRLSCFWYEAMKVCLCFDAGSVVRISPGEEHEFIYKKKDAKSLPYYALKASVCLLSWLNDKVLDLPPASGTRFLGNDCPVQGKWNISWLQTTGIFLARSDGRSYSGDASSCGPDSICNIVRFPTSQS